ncbi:hypothetical protein [Actinomadura rugatobispora]|uniref:DUF2269 family protein n=1 Tax=Actinomadura rugatobispora TaxID=1994 RepID=A0ABW1ABD0_9ACTN|nr:hypothetical protein GCM10010200_061080 [Actinomadura rugatobispora]
MDRLLLFLHIGFAIFTLGPLTAATMASPRYIRAGNTVVVGHLNRTTRIYGFATLGIFLFGLLLGRDRLAEIWLVVSMTLFVVALALLFLVERDQRKAVHLLRLADAEPTADSSENGEEAKRKKAPPKPARDGAIAQVERGRIAAVSGVVAILWLVILFLMVWKA